MQTVLSKDFFNIKEYYFIAMAQVCRCCPVFKCFEQVSETKFLISEAMLLS